MCDPSPVMSTAISPRQVTMGTCNPRSAKPTRPPLAATLVRQTTSSSTRPTTPSTCSRSVEPHARQRSPARLLTLPPPCVLRQNGLTTMDVTTVAATRDVEELNLQWVRLLAQPWRCHHASHVISVYPGHPICRRDSWPLFLPAAAHRATRHRRRHRPTLRHCG